MVAKKIDNFPPRPRYVAILVFGRIFDLAQAKGLCGPKTPWKITEPEFFIGGELGPPFFFLIASPVDLQPKKNTLKTTKPTPKLAKGHLVHGWTSRPSWTPKNLAKSEAQPYGPSRPIWVQFCRIGIYTFLKVYMWVITQDDPQDPSKHPHIHLQSISPKFFHRGCTNTF